MEKNYATDSADLIEFVTSHLKKYQTNPALFEKELPEIQNKILRAINTRQILQAIKNQIPLGVYDNSLKEGVYIKRRAEKFDRTIFPFIGTGPQSNKKATDQSKKKYYIMKDESHFPQYLLRTYWIEEPNESKEDWTELVLLFRGEPKRDQKKKGSTSNFNSGNPDDISFPDILDIDHGSDEYM